MSKNWLTNEDAYSLYSRGLTRRALGQEATVDIAKAKELGP